MVLKDVIGRIGKNLRADSDFLFSAHAHPKTTATTANHNNKGIRESPDRSASSAQSRKQFASHLVSVVTHPIGLKASISPYNANVEAMLAYLMDMLRFTETQLKKMLVKDHLEKLKSGAAVQEPVSFRKRHSWRPELKLRVCPPVSFRNTSAGSSRLDDLTVRVYLFKEEPHASLGALLDRPTSFSNPGLEGNFIETLKMSRVSTASLIRPTSEMLFELRFVAQSKDENGLVSYRTVISRGPSMSGRDDRAGERGGQQLQQDDISLAIRRYYCEPKTLHILRLEFWLENPKASGFGYLKRLARTLVHNSPLMGCLGKIDDRNLDKRPKAVYSTGNKSFYGFTNVRLTHVPAYAARATQPIMSVRQDVQVNTCELVTDIRNRRLERVAAHVFTDLVINHIRLYACCVCYQLGSIALAGDAIGSCLESGVTFDNLLYLPAHAIINQHRLQSNLTPLEDQSLRRSSLLMLFQQFNNLNLEGYVASINSMHMYKLLLISLTQHEYSAANRLFDSKTHQEVDPFHKSDAATEIARELVIDIEQNAIQSFVEDCLSSSHLSRWIASPQQISNEFSMDRSTTLACLRLARIICNHDQFGPLVHTKLSTQSLVEERRITKLVSTLVSENLARKLVQILEQTKGSSSTQESLSKAITDPGSSNARFLDPWGELLHRIQVIENDIILHWTERGLDRLDIDIGKTILTLNRKSEPINLKDFLQNKMSKYLAS